MQSHGLGQESVKLPLQVGKVGTSLRRLLFWGIVKGFHVNTWQNGLVNSFYYCLPPPILSSIPGMIGWPYLLLLSKKIRKEYVYRRNVKVKCSLIYVYCMYKE